MDALIRNLTNITLYMYIGHVVHSTIYNSTRHISKKRLIRITIDFVCVCCLLQNAIANYQNNNHLPINTTIICTYLECFL